MAPVIIPATASSFWRTMPQIFSGIPVSFDSKRYSMPASVELRSVYLPVCSS